MSKGVTGKAFIWQKGFNEDRHCLVLVTQTEQQFYCEAGPVAGAPGEHRSNPSMQRAALISIRLELQSRLRSPGVDAGYLSVNCCRNVSTVNFLPKNCCQNRKNAKNR